MTADRAAADPSAPHPLAIALMAAAVGLVPLIVFGNKTALLVFVLGAAPATLFTVVHHPRTAWLLAVACLPITTAVPIMNTGANLSVPLEVLASLLAPLLLYALLAHPRAFRRLILHPLSIAVGLQLIWMTAATVFSTDPLVSGKALAVRIVYLTVFYVGGFVILDRTDSGQGRDPIRTTTAAVLLFAVPTAFWALARHAVYGFARKESYEIAQPFFPNHTEYATVLVVWLCLAVGLRENSSNRWRRPLTLVLVLLAAAVMVAGARSAWIAVLAGLITLVASRFKPEPWRTATAAALVVLVAGTGVLGLSRHKPEKGTVSDEAAIQNRAISWLFSHDLVGGESSLERLNRWHCAARMLRDRPLFGFGPATYEMTYGSYQQHRQLTRVSTFRGDRGGAHSEFMTVAAEYGLGGLLSLTAVVFLGLRSGVRSVRHAKTSRDFHWAAVWTAVFVVLTVSSFFNSLLELDKTAPLFWLAAAVLVHLDLRSTGSVDGAVKHPESLFRRPRPTERT